MSDGTEENALPELKRLGEKYGHLNLLDLLQRMEKLEKFVDDSATFLRQGQHSVPHAYREALVSRANEIQMDEYTLRKGKGHA